MAPAQLSPDETLAGCFEAACRAKGMDEFFGQEDLRLSGREVHAQAHAFAQGLRQSGLGHGDVAAFLCASSVRHAVAFFACQLIGAVPCCLHVNETPGRLTDNLRFIGAKAIITDAPNREKVTAFEAGLPVYDLDGEGEFSYAGLIAGHLGAKIEPVAMPDDTALILMSSGTTGDPKCILHTQRTLAATAAMGPHIYDCGAESDSVIVVMAPSFAAWIHTVLPFVAIRGRIFFSSGFTPEGFLGALERERITLAPLVPTVWRMVLAGRPEEYDLDQLRCVFYSGEPGTPSLVQALSSRLCPNVLTAYLASEGGNGAGVAAGPDILGQEGRAASTGRPVPGGGMRIVDPEGGIDDDLPAGQLGEVCVSGPSLSPGYLNRDSLTTERYVDGWWRSGDLGLIDEDGNLFIHGRLDNQINSGGIKVRAEEIEAALLQHPDIRFAGVVGEPDAEWGERIEAHIVSAAPGLSPEDVVKYLGDHDLLPRHLVPKAIHFHDQLPTGPTGKLYRRGLKRG